jgi:hypothetical protein
LKGRTFKFKKDIRYPNALGAVLLTIIATQALPDHPRPQDVFLKTELQTMHNLMGK